MGGGKITVKQRLTDNIGTLNIAESAFDYHCDKQPAPLFEKLKEEQAMQSNADKLSADYDLHDKDKIIMRQHSELKLCLLVIAITMGAALFFSLQWLATRRRNRQMIVQIQELQSMQNGACRRVGASDGIIESEPAQRTDTKLAKIYLAIVTTIEKERLFLAPLTQNEFCLKIGYNRNLVAKAMLFYRGTTLIKYVTELRLIRAAELLAESKKSVERIAEESGFGTPLTLMRNFKQHYGKTPTEYRSLL